MSVSILALFLHLSKQSVSNTNQTDFDNCPGYLFGNSEAEEIAIINDKFCNGSGSPLVPIIGDVVVKMRTAERALYGSGRSVKSRYHASQPNSSIVKAMSRMNTREAEMLQSISVLRSTVINEEIDEDDPISLGLEVVDSTGMFRTLILSLATLRHEIASYILRTDPSFHAAYRTTILNVPAIPTVLGGTDDEVDQQAVEKQRRLTEW